MSFLSNITSNNEAVSNYYVVALKNSNYEKKEDLKNLDIYYVSGFGDNDEAMDKLMSEVSNKKNTSINVIELANGLLSGEYDLIMLPDYHMGILGEEIEDFEKNTKIVYEFSIKKKNVVESKDVDVTKVPFNIYLSGIDTFGEIGSVSRSDVNMIVTINPQTHQILLTSIPRDYYVGLSCANGAKDKLTHAGLYGVECSMGTIGDLLDVDINYFIRVNFSSLINIVDVLGGVNVYSEYAFESNFYFNQGYNYLNGEQALAFSRARYNFVDGDRQRGKNQQAVIKAIVNKALSPEILSKYANLLDVLKDSFQTNFDVNDVQKLAKFQLEKNPNWTISNVSVNGFDSSNYTYSFAGQMLYVMEPDYSTVDVAKGAIASVLKGQNVDLNATVADGQNTAGRASTPVVTTTTTTTTVAPTTTTTTVVQTTIPVTVPVVTTTVATTTVVSEPVVEDSSDDDKKEDTDEEKNEE